MPTGCLCNLPRRRSSLFLLFCLLCSVLVLSGCSSGSSSVSTRLSRSARLHKPYPKSQAARDAGAERNPELDHGTTPRVVRPAVAWSGTLQSAGSMNVMLQAVASQTYSVLCTGTGGWAQRPSPLHRGRLLWPRRQRRRAMSRHSRAIAAHVAPLRRARIAARGAPAASNTFLLETRAEHPQFVFRTHGDCACLHERILKT